MSHAGGETVPVPSKGLRATVLGCISGIMICAVVLTGASSQKGSEASIPGYALLAAIILAGVCGIFLRTRRLLPYLWLVTLQYGGLLLGGRLLLDMPAMSDSEIAVFEWFFLVGGTPIALTILWLVAFGFGRWRAGLEGAAMSKSR